MTRFLTALALLTPLSGCGEPPPDASPLIKAMAFIGNTLDAVTDQYDGGPVTTTCSPGKGGSYSCTTY
jgi:hypothetical protein